MSLLTLGVGPYVMSYMPSSIAAPTNGNNVVGLVEGPRILRQGYTAKMMQSDLYGPGTDVEGIMQGGNVHLSMTLKEWSSIEQAMLWPFADNMGDVGQVGRLLSDLAGILVLTPVANTPANANGPQNITAKKAILAPNNDWEMIMGTDARDIPIVFQLLPYLTTSSQPVLQWYAISTSSNVSPGGTGLTGSQSGSGPSI